MKEILNKISSYNLFNYLLSGVLFVVLIENFTNFSCIQEDVVIGFFVYYFAGVVVSRFGSLVIEPILKKLSILKFAPYSDFVHASKKDGKIEILSEANNMYRTFISIFVLILLIQIYEYIKYMFPIVGAYSFCILIILLIFLFLCSYIKQTNYITKIIEANTK